MGGLSACSEGVRSSGVRWRVVSEDRPPLRITYLVISLDDGDVDELATGDSGVGWELVVRH
jgi:hypothetical protein